MTTSTIKLISLFITVFLFALSCNALEAKINMNPDGHAIKGYDTVAYFTMGKPVPGKIEFQHIWQDAKWLFSSLEHLQLFQENPAKYIPQYGGY
jgi:YHS domain-containing protein